MGLFDEWMIKWWFNNDLTGFFLWWVHLIYTVWVSGWWSFLPETNPSSSQDENRDLVTHLRSCPVAMPGMGWWAKRICWVFMSNFPQSIVLSDFNGTKVAIFFSFVLNRMTARLVAKSWNQSFLLKNLPVSTDLSPSEQKISKSTDFPVIFHWFPSVLQFFLPEKTTSPTVAPQTAPTQWDCWDPHR